MRKWIQLLLCLYCLAGISQVAAGEESPDASSHATVSLLSEEKAVTPGQPFWVVIHLQVEKNWHSYWKNPGDAGMAPVIEWDLPSGYLASEISWPAPKRFVLDSIVGFGYEGEVLLLSKITPPATISSPDPIKIAAKVRWLVCSDAFCVPGESESALTLPISTAPAGGNSELKEIFARARAQLPEKQGEAVTAYRNRDFIELNVHLPRGEPTSAYFCPEDSELVDHAADPTLVSIEQSPNHYLLGLKRASSNHVKVKNLKGVLVLNHGDGKSSAHAIEIDVPIVDVGNDTSVISMNDRSVNDQAGIAIPPENSLPTTFEGGLQMALLLAFVGGMILNLMPCVLPVISLKVLSFIKLSGQSRMLTLKHGFAFSSGVLISFWVLAGALLILQAYGHIVGWGFQLQEPLFVGILASILMVLALSFFGVFEMGSFVTSWAGGQVQQKKEGLGSSFFSGILATAVATPCTGPFLGSALGFALTVSPLKALSIFTALGSGMAMPYVLLAAYPNLLRFLPKPGHWMATFKEVMGFFMLATVLWLVWVFGAQTDSLAVFFLLTGFFCLALACWIFGKWGAPVQPFKVRVVSYVLTIICVVAGGYAILSSSSWERQQARNQEVAASHHSWEKFSAARVDELRRQGTPVLIDFTAKWCLICQVNHLVLSSDKVEQKLNELGVVKMKADWTKNDPEITEELRKQGRTGVPLYLLYSGDISQPAQVMPQVLTPDIVLQYLQDLEHESKK